MQSSDVYAILSSRLKSVVSGFDHAEATGDNTFDIYFVDGSKVSLTIPQKDIDYNIVSTLAGNYLNAHKEDFKGEDGKTVQILGDGEEVDPKAVFVIDPTSCKDLDTYTKAQADSRFAKAIEVGSKADLIVNTWADLVDAINNVYKLGAGKFSYANKKLTITTRGGLPIVIDVSAIITDTNIDELKNVAVTSVLDNQSLVWSEARQKWINKTVSSTSILNEAKKYTDDEIRKINNALQIACDSKPTYDGGVVEYVKGGLTYTTSNPNTWFYYVDAEGTAYQTIWIDDVEFTFVMSGIIDLDDYVQTTKVTSDSTVADRTLIPDLTAIDTIVSGINTSIGAKVSTADIVDTLVSESTDVPLSANQGRVLKNSIGNIINDTTASTTNAYSSSKVDTLLGNKVSTSVLEATLTNSSSKVPKSSAVYSALSNKANTSALGTQVTMSLSGTTLTITSK